MTYNLYKTKNGRTKLHGRGYSEFLLAVEGRVLMEHGYEVKAFEVD